MSSIIEILNRQIQNGQSCSLHFVFFPCNQNKCDARDNQTKGKRNQTTPINK